MQYANNSGSAPGDKKKKEKVFCLKILNIFSTPRYILIFTKKNWEPSYKSA